MKKLLDREPTEEMIAALMRESINWDLHLSRRDVIEAMNTLFDAAPELTVDMEPFGYAKRCGNKRIDSWEYQISDAHEPIYPATQLAALQAENEQPRKENEELKMGLSDVEFVAKNTERLCLTLTAERDELLAVVRSALKLSCTIGSADNERAVYALLQKAIAKHEGEKHD